MPSAMAGKSNFRGFILPELNDALTSLYILGEIAIVNPHFLNWSAGLWLVGIGPIIFLVSFHCLVWRFRPESRDKHRIRQIRHLTMEEMVAIIGACVEEIYQNDPVQDQTPKATIPQTASFTPRRISPLPTPIKVPQLCTIFAQSASNPTERLEKRLAA